MTSVRYLLGRYLKGLERAGWLNVDCLGLDLETPGQRCLKIDVESDCGKDRLSTALHEHYICVSSSKSHGRKALFAGSK